MSILSILVIIFGILVVSSISTIYSVLWLVITFITVSIILVFFDSSFVSLIYIIVYVGAIAILFLFVVQLLDLTGITGSRLDLSFKENVGKINNWKFLDKGFLILFIISFISAIIAILFPGSLSNYMSILSEYLVSETIFTNIEYKNIFNSGDVSQVKSLAEWLYGSNLICLIIIGIILLISMIAPIYLCKE